MDYYKNNVSVILVDWSNLASALQFQVVKKYE